MRMLSNILLHEDVNETDADSQFTHHERTVLKMSLALDVVMHSLEFLLLQSNQVTIVPVMVVGQQSLINVNRVPFLRHCSFFSLQR